MRIQTKIIYILLAFLFMPASKGEKLNMQSIQLNTDLALKYLLKEPQLKTAKKKVIILLHGVGSNESDLFSLAEQLPKDFYIISARGKFTLSEGSYAWYNVDFSTGKPVYNKEQEQESREAILLFIQQVKDKYRFEEVYLGGFSQGAIMSYSIGLLHPTMLKGIFCLSGRLLQEIRSEVKPGADLQKLKVFVAHGTQDGTLPVSYAREAKTFLEQLHIKLNYHEFAMAHQVIGDELGALNVWLKE